MMRLYQPAVALEIKDGVFKTKIEGLYYLSYTFSADERGFFAEVGHAHKIEAVAGQPFKIAQVNHSRSNLNVVRGLHAEGWNKLTTVINGLAFSALADVRPESPTFGQVEAFELGPDNGGLKGLLYISQGIANSVCVLKAPVDYIYCVDKLYQDRDKAGDQAISLFDPDLNIAWPIKREQMIISTRDKDAVMLRQKFPQKFT